jgi:hypothetical protein
VMKLGFYNQARRFFGTVRDLTKAEIDNHVAYAKVFAEARDRLRLFRILDHNFREWRSYLDSLLTTQNIDSDKATENIDRLLLNYLSCAYAIKKHFEVSLRQRFRKDSKKLKQYADFVNQLCLRSWAFAFFLDFRGYVQHRGLGIGEYTRNVGSAVVNISITRNAADLVSESRDWKRSKLDASRGTLDLISLLEEFHIHMRQHYAEYVVNTFFPELLPAARFYANLTAEVHKKDAFSRMVFYEGDPKVTQHYDRTEYELPLLFPPNDLFRELGILVKQDQQK